VGRAVKKYNATEVFRREHKKVSDRIAEEKAKLDRIKAMTKEEYNKYFYEEMIQKFPTAQQTASGLMYVMIDEGQSPKAEAGFDVSVHYTGNLIDGTKFDSSHDRNQPFDLKLGKGSVIKGWDEGLTLVGKGGKLKLIIPYHLAYGERGNGKIPPFSTLTFDIDMLDAQLSPEAKMAKMSPEEYNRFFYETMIKRYPNAQQTASGLMYVIQDNGRAEKPQRGDNVSVHYTGTLLDGKKFDSSVDRGQPIQIPIGTGRVIRGWDEGIPMLGKGGKAILLIPHYLAYGETGNNSIPGYSPLIFKVELLDFEPSEEAKIAEMTEEEYRKYFYETTIKKYPTAQQTPSGLMYVMHKPGAAQKPQAGQTVSVHYTGTLTNGTKFDSSRDSGQPIEFPIGQRRVISGWDEGIPLLGKGGKATLIIPYFLGYGPNGTGPIPPYATLIFDVELMDIK
jgi:peptidylprolyl isomerase